MKFHMPKYEIQIPDENFVYETKEKYICLRKLCRKRVYTTVTICLLLKMIKNRKTNKIKFSK